MQKTFKLFVLIACFGLLTACITINFDGNSEPNDQDEADTQEEETESDSNEEDEEPATEDNEDEKESNEPDPSDEDSEDKEILLENEAFKIFEPAPDKEVTDQFVVRGLARVFEATLQYTLEDGHFIVDKGFTTATKGGPEWGEFEITFDLDGVPDGSYRVVLFEESAEDGSIVNELIIPVQVVSQ